MKFKFYEQLTPLERKQRAQMAKKYLSLSWRKRKGLSFREWMESLPESQPESLPARA